MTTSSVRDPSIINPQLQEAGSLLPPISRRLYLDKENAVEYCIMQPSDIDATLSVIVNSFINGEPIRKSIGATSADVKKFTSMCIHRMAREGNSIIAIDTNNGNVLGAFLNEDFRNATPPDLGANKEADGNWEALFEILGELEEALLKKYDIPKNPNDRPPGQCFHLFYLGVAPESRGRGVGRNLLVQSCLHAKSKGFQLGFAVCTGAISTHLFKKFLGAQVESFVDYSMYTGPYHEHIVTIPSTGHSGASLVTLSFDEYSVSK